MKRKVNNNRAEISKEEIEKHKDFNSVLKQSISMGKPFFKKPLFLSGVAVVVVGIAVSLVLITKNKTKIAADTNLKEEVAEMKAGIHPPVKGLNVGYTSYNVIAEDGAVLDAKTSSKLSVPKNAFVDEKGNIVKGQVELRYREFKDAIDFFVSGIPMTYDSAGIKYQFQSAGMMEMLAYQNGKQVNMASGKSIEVKLATKDTGNEYNLYKLDTVHNNWSCLGKDKVVKENNNSTGIDTSARKLIAIEQTPAYKDIETKKESAKQDKETAIAALPKVVEPKKPMKVNKEKYTFNIEVDAKEFPELDVYKGVLFEIGNENTDFSKSMYDITWDDADLKEGNKKGENYLLTLTKGTKKYKLVVYPVFEGKNYESALGEYQSKFNKYIAVIDKRKADEKRIVEEYEAKVAAYTKKQEELFNEARLREAAQFKQMTNDEKAFRVFDISSFGVYNSDACKQFPQGVRASINLMNEKNEPMHCYTTYLVDKERNSLFTYEKNPVVNFSFNPESKNMLWTVENGELYWLKPTEFYKITNSGDVKNIGLTKVGRSFGTVDEMKAYFNF